MEEEEQQKAEAKKAKQKAEESVKKTKISVHSKAKQLKACIIRKRKAVNVVSKEQRTKSKKPTRESTETPTSSSKAKQIQASLREEGHINCTYSQGSKYFFLHGSCFVGLYKKVAPINTISMELIFIHGGSFCHHEAQSP